MAEKKDRECVGVGYKITPQTSNLFKEDFMSIYIGVDPGKNGAVAFYDDKKGEYSVFDVLDPDALDTLRAIARKKVKKVAIVEKVHAGGFRKDKKTGKPIKAGVTSSGTFMRFTGRVEGWLQAFGVPFHEMTKAKWWKVVAGSTAMGKTTDERKTASLDLARRLFPSMADFLKRKKDHSRAEALLICEAARKQGL